MAMNVDFYDVIAKDGQTSAERFAGMTKDADSFYTVGTDLYLGEIKLSNAADLSVAVANIAQNAADITTINTTLTKLENTEETAGSIRAIIKSYLEGLDVTEFAIADIGTGADANKVSIYGVKEVDGKIEKGANAVQLAAVAKTGAAGDVSYDNTTSGLTATNVKAAIDEVASASAGGVDSKTIWFTDNTSGQSDYAKVYKIYQGANAPDADTNPAVLKGTINIPKDKVLQDADIVTITFSNGHLYDDSVDVTELIVGAGGTATAADAGKYLKMEMQNVSNPLYVNLQIFVDVYTAASGATEVQIAINNHEISASIVAVDGSKVIYKAETTAGAGDGETVKQALTRLDGADTVTGSVSKKIKDAVEALDTASDVTIASKSGNAVTITGSIAESDGIVGDGSASDITLADVASTGAAEDVEYQAAAGADPAVSVKDALDDIYSQIGEGGSVEQQIEDAINALDGSATIASKSGDIITLKAGVSEADGVISNSSASDIALAAVASTGAAADVALTDTGNNFTTDNVEAALSEIASRLTWTEI